MFGVQVGESQPPSVKHAHVCTVQWAEYVASEDFPTDILDPCRCSRSARRPSRWSSCVVVVMNDEQSQEVEALAAIMGEDMWTDAEQPGSHCFFVSPQCDSDTEVRCHQGRGR